MLQLYKLGTMTSNERKRRKEGWEGGRGEGRKEKGKGREGRKREEKERKEGEFTTPFLAAFLILELGLWDQA